MESRFRVAGHPAHPMLVMFPVALLPLLLVLDLVHRFVGAEGAWEAGFWVAAVGLVTTVVAIVPGLVDMAAIPNESRAHRTAVFHTIVGFTILAVYAATTFVRWPAGSAPDQFGLALGIDVVGVLLVTIQGWLGGELVYKHHIGVRTPAEGGDPVALDVPAAAKRGPTGRERGG
jgi:uncharacterized membrane protein